MYHAYKEISEPCIAALVAQTASAQFHRLVSTSDGFYNRQKILSILPFPKPFVYTWGIDVEKVGIDDRRIATGVLYERMKHIAGCDLRLYVDVCKGAQDAACHPVKLLTDRARGRLRRDNTVI